MPVEPKKVISVAAISQGWTADLVTASGLGLGLIWFVLVLSGLLRKLISVTPVVVVRGIQLALGISLGLKALRMMAPEPWLGVLAIGIIIVLQGSRRAPAALVIMGLGAVVMALRGLPLRGLAWSVTWPRFMVPRWRDVLQAMWLGGFAQIPLSITNAVIATAAMIRDYFPERPVSEDKLMLNMGVMNVASSLFGGMPMCHGSGGLAAQHYFGARTGGANILEGLIEIGMGIFLGPSLVDLLNAFPMPLIGGMMGMVGISLAKVVIPLRGWDLSIALVTALVSAASNMALGFLVGLGLSTAVAHVGQERYA
jgi:MFS superfamily sulfate permease-like transporter